MCRCLRFGESSGPGSAGLEVDGKDGGHPPIPNANCGQVQLALTVPSIRDRVVQGAMKLILEPIFEADFQPGSFGYRPKKSAHTAIQRVPMTKALRPLPEGEISR